MEGLEKSKPHPLTLKIRSNNMPKPHIQKSKELSSSDIWKLFEKTNQLIDKQAKEADRRAKKMALEDARRAREADRRAKEADDRRAKKLALEEALRKKEDARHKKEATRLAKKIALEEALRKKESDLLSKELKIQMKETDRRLNKLHHLFTGHWGKFMEALTKGGLLKALRERNIEVTGILPNAEKVFNGQRREFDIVAINGKEIVVVEVKTTLKIQHINWFLEGMKDFKNYFPEYKDRIVYGAVAYLSANENSDVYSAKKGLFILNPIGNIVKIMNPPRFKPKQLA